MSIRTHPVHPLLAAIAVGLWMVSLFCDLLYLGGAEADPKSGLAIALSVIGVSILAVSSWLGGASVRVQDAIE